MTLLSSERFEEGLALLAQAAVQLERAGDVEGCLTALDRLAFGRLQHGALEEAAQAAHHQDALARADGHPGRRAAATQNLALLAWRRGGNQEALQLMRRARAWAGQGYGVNVASKGAVDLRLTQNGQTTLVSAKRWKAATHGVEPLRELYSAMQAENAQGGIYVAGQGTVSETAALFARDHGITILQGPALAVLLLG